MSAIGTTPTDTSPAGSGTAAADQGPVLYRREGAVALLTLNRPDRLNAWNGAMEARYFELLDRAAADPEVRAIVVTGAGRGYCAGADMDLLQGIGDRGGTDAGVAAQGEGGQGEAARPGVNDQSEMDGRSRPEHRPVTWPLALPKPVIAAINGACAGIGLVQALGCDLRFAAQGAKLTTAFSRRGLVAEHGASWLLPRLIGPARALDLLLSARVVLAEEALEMGLVNRVVAPEALLGTTLAYAADLAQHCAPSSMAAIKGQVYRHLETGLEEAMADSDRLMAASLRSADFREGVASFVERRAPQFGAQA